jgi:hypothetical protein
MPGQTPKDLGRHALDIVAVVSEMVNGSSRYVFDILRFHAVVVSDAGVCDFSWEVAVVVKMTVTNLSATSAPCQTSHSDGYFAKRKKRSLSLFAALAEPW